MNEHRFWSIIDLSMPAVAGDFQAQLSSLRHLLSDLSTEDLKEFETSRWLEKSKITTVELSEAAFIINNGMDDDDFEYFLSGIVCQGHDFYQRILEAPEPALIANPVTPLFIKYAGLEFIVDEIYSERVGEFTALLEDLSMFDSEFAQNMSSYCEDEAHLRNRFPKLFEKFWAQKMGLS